MRQVHFTLDTDASCCGIGAVLPQEEDGLEKVIGYDCKTLHRAQKNWCVTIKELYVVKAISNFHTLLIGRKLVVRTDHMALQWLMNFKSPEAQTAHWLEYLQTYEYNFDVCHRHEKSHINADSLSRRPCEECVLLPCKVASCRYDQMYK